MKEIYGKSKLWLKVYSYPRKRTLDLEYEDEGDELQNLITEITVIPGPDVFISVTCHHLKNSPKKLTFPAKQRSSK